MLVELEIFNNENNKKVIRYWFDQKDRQLKLEFYYEAVSKGNGRYFDVTKKWHRTNQQRNNMERPLISEQERKMALQKFVSMITVEDIDVSNNLDDLEFIKKI